nr:unnamed protein product [Callosobruchus analis]
MFCDLNHRKHQHWSLHHHRPLFESHLQPPWAGEACCALYHTTLFIFRIRIYTRKTLCKQTGTEKIIISLRSTQH